MQFASMGSVWLALSLLFIVLLYLLKRRYADTIVPSHLLWRKALREQEANRPWQRLNKQLLLWLQLLAAALLVLALMQPQLRGQGRAQANVLFVLDASASMQAVAGDGTRLEQAKRLIMEDARGAASGSVYSLLVIKDEPELKLQKQSGTEALGKALEEVAPFYGKVNYKESLSLASALTKQQADTEVRVYTDLQWTEPADGVYFDVPVSIHDAAGPEAQGNVSLVRFGVKQSEGAGGIQGVASLKNWSAVPAAFEAIVYAGNVLVGTSPVTLQPGEQRAIYFEGLGEAAYYRLEIDSKDAFAADNEAYAFPEGGGPKLAVYAGSGSLFLEKALAVAHVDLLKLQKSADGTYPPPSGQTPDFFIVDGVDRSALQGTDWQRLLASVPLWELPSASAAEAGHPASPPYEISDHPVTRYVTWKDVHVAAVQSASDGFTGSAVIRADQRALLLAGVENGVPRLQFAFALEHSDLPLRPEFPILVQNAAQWLTAQQGGSLGRAVAGESVELALHPETAAAQWRPVRSDGSPQAAEKSGAAIAARQTVPGVPGLYLWTEADRNGNMLQERMLEVSVDPAEMNVGGRVDFKPGGEAQQEASAGGGERPRHEALIPLLPWAAACLLLVLLAEWEVYRRGHSI